MGTVEETAKQGSCLRTLLILWLFTSPLSEIIYIVIAVSASQTLATLPEFFFPLRGLFYIANFMCVIGIWEYKKWGVMGVVALVLLTFFINVMTIGLPASVYGFFLGLINIALLAYLVRPIWHQME